MAIVRAAGFNDADVVNVMRALRNRAWGLGTTPNIAPGTTTSTIKTNNIIVADVDGVRINKAAADPNPAALLAGLGNLTSAQGCVIRIEMGSTGTITAKQGPIVAAGASDNIKTLPVPLRTAALVTIGYLVITGVTFTMNTTAITAGMCNDGDPDLLPNYVSASGAFGLES